MKTLSLKEAIFTALMAALLCVLAPFSLPIGPIPITLATFIIYLIAYLLKWHMALISVVLYLIIGIVGIPVFSGFRGGLGVVAGPTGGYLIGYLLLVLSSALLLCHSRNRIWAGLSFVIGTVLLYLFGTVWYCIYASVSFIPALSVCVIPFLPGDLIKIIVALIVAPMISQALEKSGFLNHD